MTTGYSALLTTKLMKFYHQGSCDALDHVIAKMGPRGETNVVRTLGDGGRILP